MTVRYLNGQQGRNVQEEDHKKWTVGIEEIIIITELKIQEAENCFGIELPGSHVRRLLTIGPQKV